MEENTEIIGFYKNIGISRVLTSFYLISLLVVFNFFVPFSLTKTSNDNADKVSTVIANYNGISYHNIGYSYEVNDYKPQNTYVLFKAKIEANLLFNEVFDITAIFLVLLLVFGYKRYKTNNNVPFKVYKNDKI